MKQISKNYILSALLLIILAIVYLLPIQVPNNISVSGKIFPAKEWLLIKGTDGRLMSSLKNNIKGINENYSVTQFQRGDAIQFSLSSEIQTGYGVSVNDTVGMIYSNETEKELIDLRTELAAESALLKVNLSEEKEAIVKSEEQRLEYAKKQLEEQEKIFRRQQSLYEKNLISQEEYEVASGAVELFRINVDIAEERLKTVTTGAKEEEIDFIKSKIEGLKQRIDVLEKKFSDFVIQSPIDGIVQRVFSSDTLIVINDTTQFIGLFPVNLKYFEDVKDGQIFIADLLMSNNAATGQVISIDRTIQTVANSQYFVATVLFDSNYDLLPGLVAEGNIVCEKVYISDLINSFLISLIK